MTRAAFIQGALDQVQRTALAVTFRNMVSPESVARFIDRVDKILATEERLYLPAEDDDGQRLERLENLGRQARAFNRALIAVDDDTRFLMRQERLTTNVSWAEFVLLNQLQGQGAPNAVFDQTIEIANAIDVCTRRMIKRGHLKLKPSKSAGATDGADVDAKAPRRVRRIPSDSVIIAMARLYAEEFGEKPAYSRHSLFNKLLSAVVEVKGMPSVGEDRLRRLLTPENVPGVPLPKRGRKPRANSPT